MSTDERNKHELVSAQVVLRAASGRSPDRQTPITSANIQDFLPSTEIAASAKDAFTVAGFEVGPLVGSSFPITAPAGTFEKMFKTHLRRNRLGGIEAMQDNGSWGEEVPLEGLRKALSRNLVAVTFTRPPDFGPTHFS
jgi:hypothetical protein